MRRNTNDAANSSYYVWLWQLFRHTLSRSYCRRVKLFTAYSQYFSIYKAVPSGLIDIIALSLLWYVSPEYKFILSIKLTGEWGNWIHTDLINVICPFCYDANLTKFSMTAVNRFFFALSGKYSQFKYLL